MTQPQDDQQYIDEYIERTRLKAIDTSSTSAQSLPMSSSYRHQRLPSEPCIRLLFPELPERDEEDFLCYNLCTIRLSDKPLYAALSYTWGSPGYDVSHPYEIRVNGQYMTVTPNLWTAMSNLKTSRPEYVSVYFFNLIARGRLKEVSPGAHLSTSWTARYMAYSSYIGRLSIEIECLY